MHYPNTSFTFFSNILLHSEINRGEKQSSLIEELTSINNGSSQIQSYTIIMSNYNRKFKHNFYENSIDTYRISRVFRVMTFLFFMDYSNMRIQSDIKIKKAIRLIDERIHLLTKIKREWNDKQKDKLLPDNERTGTELLDSMIRKLQEIKDELT